jgi:hypothetical protein
MKAMILAAVAAVTLGVGVASAQGVPAGYSPRDYGATWANNQQAAERLNATHHARAAQPAAPGAANSSSASTANGG